MFSPSSLNRGFRHICFCQCHSFYSLSTAAKSCSNLRTERRLIAASASSSVRVRDVSCKIKPKATLFSPASIPGPLYTSKIVTLLYQAPVLPTATAFDHVGKRHVLSFTKNEMSRRIAGNFETAFCFRNVLVANDLVGIQFEKQNAFIQDQITSAIAGCNFPTTPTLNAVTNNACCLSRLQCAVFSFLERKFSMRTGNARELLEDLLLCQRNQQAVTVYFPIAHRCTDPNC